jgi:UDP-N-acetylglucosamine--N-acetylmuramyl-(pentapeptide) pyrophosphoryl-undecaprenol N-acetylglucosamine transferase
MSMAPIVILAGGTGGHIFPGLAVAAALSARAAPVVWIGAHGGMETRLVPAQGIELRTLSITGLRGKGLAALAVAPVRLIRAVWQGLRALREIRPAAVISFGGFAAGPGGLAAWLLRIPLLVHEQNRAPGLTNRVLARLAARVLCGFPDTFPGLASETVGNPVRAGIAALAPPGERLAGRSGPVRVLVLGGSQGARALNRTVPGVLARCAGSAMLEVRHQCGRNLLPEADSAYADTGLLAQLLPFIDDMAEAYGWADLVICRAGALTLAELAAAGLPAVLVPFPAAVDDHQTRNAEFMVERGAAVLVAEGEGFDQRLQDALTPLLTQPQVRRDMAQAARALALPDAAAQVADIALAEVSS